MRRLSSTGLAVAAALFVGLVAVDTSTLAQRGAPAGASSPQEITVQSRVLDSFSAGEAPTRRVGALQFRGGVVLTSSAREFGGLSSIRLDPTGEHFIAISDKADWITGRILYKNHAPVGVADVRVAPMLDASGRTVVAARRWYDSEALAFDGATAYVAFERVHQIMRFDFGAGRVLSRGQPIAVPPAMRTMPANRGIEALLVAPKASPVAGALIAFAERALDASGNHLGFIIGGPSPGQFTLARSGDYDVTDAALLPGGDVVVLERKFSLLSGVGARIRRIPLKNIRPGAHLDGPVIFEADMGYEIDNFEGVDAFRDASGETVLTLVSDDNFSRLQRTLLLQFTLAE